MNNDELPPHIENELRNVSPASDSVREMHIANALAELAPKSRSRRPLIAAAAAVIVLLGGGAIVRSQQSDLPVVASPDTTAVSFAPKGGAGESGECSAEFSGLWGDSSLLGNFTIGKVQYAVIGHNGGLDVYFASQPCSPVGSIEYWDAMSERDREGTDATSTSPLCKYASNSFVTFEDRANGATYTFVLVASETDVSLHFEDRCNETLGSIAFP